MTNTVAPLRKRIKAALLLCIAFSFLATAADCSAKRLQLNEIRLPPGFEISVYGDNVPGARSLALGNKGTVFVGTRDEGKVYALPDRLKKNVQTK